MRARRKTLGWAVALAMLGIAYPAAAQDLPRCAGSDQPGEKVLIDEPFHAAGGSDEQPPTQADLDLAGFGDMDLFAHK